MLDYLFWHKTVLLTTCRVSALCSSLRCSCLTSCWVFTVSVKPNRNLVSSQPLPAAISLHKMFMQLVIDQSAHPTFLIKFQVNWLWRNVPEAERQSGSEDDPQLPVCEPQQQEKGKTPGLLSALNSTHYSLCVRAALVCCSAQAEQQSSCEMSFPADCADVWLVVLGCQEDAQNRTDCLFTCRLH